MPLIYFLEDKRTVMWWCPGCDRHHGVPVTGPNKWGWNMSIEKPTFTPSVLCKGTHDLTETEHAAIMRGEKVEPRSLVCHCYVREGKIEFLSDCEHPLAGKTVPMTDMDKV